MTHTTTIPTAALTTDAYNYYKDLMRNCPPNTEYFGADKLFLKLFLDTIKENDLPGELYSAIDNDGEEFLDLILLSKSLTKKQVIRVHSVLKSSEQKRAELEPLLALLKNADYTIDQTLIMDLVFIIHKIHGPHSPFFQTFLEEVLKQCNISGHILEKMLYLESSPLYNDQVVLGEYRVALALVYAWHRAWTNVVAKNN